ncbi:hypothetical protein RIF29_34827 [Crotalaria pallida]|uniref:Uncharacterized protein n=1 Tax=Crotalaria pallida TaxID=3830 RepID=A0AAN9EAH7_CROPI
MTVKNGDVWEEEPWKGLTFVTVPEVLREASKRYVGCMIPGTSFHHRRRFVAKYGLHGRGNVKDLYGFSVMVCQYMLSARISSSILLEPLVLVVVNASMLSQLHFDVARILIRTTMREAMNRLLRVCIHGEIFEIHSLEDSFVDFFLSDPVVNKVYEREVTIESFVGSVSLVEGRDEELVSENSVYSLHERFEEDVLEKFDLQNFYDEKDVEDEELSKNMATIMVHSL